MNTDAPTLFEVDTPPVAVPRRRKESTRPVWMKYRPKNPVKCDDCMLLLAQRHGEGPASRSAKWRRKVGRDDLLLCYGHADARRAIDGLPKLDHEA